MKRQMEPAGRMPALVVALALGAIPPALAQAPMEEPPPPAADAATREDVQRETDEAIRAVQSYSAAQRRAAEARAREAVDRMRERTERLQDDWARERVQYDEAARERRARMLDGARERLEVARQRSAELDAAGEAEWQRARERFIESYRALSADVRSLVERSMPGRPVPADATDDADDADGSKTSEDAAEDDVPHPGGHRDHRDDTPRDASHPGVRP